MVKKISLLLLLGCLTCLNGCMSIHEQVGAPPVLAKHAKWTVIPFYNQTATPYAGERAAAISRAILNTRGLKQMVYVRKPKSSKSGIAEQLEPMSLSDSISLARRNQVRYLLTGHVTEWRYKVGLDGEPAVGVTLQLIDTASAKTIWHAVASGIGGSRDALSTLAQKVLHKALKDLS